METKPGHSASPSSEQQEFPIQQTLERAIRLHKAGDLSQAGELYQQVLQADPGQPVALHFLGLIASQEGRYDVAVELITKALAIKPDYIEAHVNLGNGLKALGRLNDAIDSYRKALAINPDFAEAHGNLGAAFRELGRMEDAIGSYRKALDINPDMANAHFNLGNALRALGQLDDAVDSYRRAIAIKPDSFVMHETLADTLQDLDKLNDAVENYTKALAIDPQAAEAHTGLGTALKNIGLLDDAIASFTRAIEINPELAVAHNNLGNALGDLGHPRKATASYHKALAIDPDYAEAHSNLGLALMEQGLMDEALSSHHKALAIEPDLAGSHINLGLVFQNQGLLDKAIASYRKALAIEPDLADAHNNLGAALQKLGRLDDSILSIEKAIALKPEFCDAHNNLGNTLAMQGEFNEAIASYRRALEIDPDHAGIHSNLIFTQDFLTDFDVVDHLAELRRWNDKFILPLADKIKPHANDRNPDRRLRIGYVSADFKIHSACQGFASLILDHDRDQFEVFCYDGNVDPDAMTETLRRAAASWRSTVGKSDDALAETIRKDGIDILVDLSGHTNGNRLVVFGHKPAPIQVDRLGLGISTIDYRLTSALTTPPEEEDIYIETPVYLSTFCGLLMPADTPPVGGLPSSESGNITFGCLNRLAKVTDDTLALWAGILLDVADSRLLFKDPYLDEPANRQRLQEFFSGHGITEDRLVLLGRTPQREHLDAYNRVDITLDPFPQGGGISTLESLWMGVPVLGLYGSRKITNRMIKFLIQPLGLHEWISESTDEYHQMAVKWAGQREALANLRPGLRQRVSEIYSRYPDDIGNAYRIMWKRWCEGEPPVSLDFVTGPS